MGTGETEAAEESLRKGIDLGSNTKAAYFALISACMRNGKREDAKKFREIYESFKPSQRVDPSERYDTISESNGRVLLTFILSEAALIYEQAGLNREAEHHLLRILALNPEEQATLNRLAALYASLGRKADAELVRNRIMALGPQGLMDYLRLAKSESDAGNNSAAEAIIKLAITYAPQSVPAYAAMTDFLLEQNRPEDAQWYIEQAVQIEPSREGFRLLIRTLRVQGKEQQAQRIEEQIQQLSG